MLRGKLMAANNQPISFVGGSSRLLTGAVGNTYSIQQELFLGTNQFGQAGNLSILILGFGASSSSALPNSVSIAVSGYSLLGSTYANKNGGAILAAYGKILTANVLAGETITAVASGALFGASYSMLTVWKNTNGLDTPLTSASSIVSGFEPDAPAVTTATNDTVVLAAGYYINRSGTISDLTVPAGMSDAAYNNSGTSDYGFTASVALPGLPQTYDPARFGGGGPNALNSWCAATIALRRAGF